MEFVKNVERLIHPLKVALANMIVRGVVQLADDAKRLQMLQVGGFEGGPLDECEHFQQYGFSSVPLAGAEVVAIFPNGDRAHPLIIASGDRASRPTGSEPGTVTLYSDAGARVDLLPNGDIVATPAAGRFVLLGSDGATEPLVTRSEFNAHTHAGTGMAAGGDPVTGATMPPSAVAGTARVRAE